jgi:putative oxidoreductase
MFAFLNSLEKTLTSHAAWGPFVLRLFVGVRLFYGVIDNVLSWGHMMEFAGFLESFGFPLPVASAVVSVWAQFLASIMLIVGWKVRTAGIVMMINFVVAMAMVHIPAGDTFEAMTPPLAMLFGALTLVFSGPGRLALERTSRR